MTTRDNLTTAHRRGQIVAPGEAAMAGRLWRVEAMLPGEADWATRVIEADEAQPWTGGVLFLFDHGKKSALRRTVLALAPGRWRSCEPAK